MLSELNHVQGNWAALTWAFGSASVLAKHALLFRDPSSCSRRRTLSLRAGDLFYRGAVPCARPALAATAACVDGASFLFLRGAGLPPSVPRFPARSGNDRLPYPSDDGSPTIRIRNWKLSRGGPNETTTPRAWPSPRMRHPESNPKARGWPMKPFVWTRNLTWVYAVVAVRALLASGDRPLGPCARAMGSPERTSPSHRRSKKSTSNNSSAKASLIVSKTNLQPG